MKVRLALLAIATVISVSTFSVLLSNTQREHIQAHSTQQTQGIDTASLEKLVNDYRVKNGLQPLVHDERLCQSAQAKLDDMVSKRYFEHDTLDGKEFSVFITPYREYEQAGENLAAGNDNHQAVMTGWVNSPKHREAMLRNFTDTCIRATHYGTYQQYKNSYFVVQHFAR